FPLFRRVDPAVGLRRLDHRLQHQRRGRVLVARWRDVGLAPVAEGLVEDLAEAAAAALVRGARRAVGEPAEQPAKKIAEPAALAAPDLAEQVVKTAAPRAPARGRRRGHRAAAGMAAEFLEEIADAAAPTTKDRALAGRRGAARRPPAEDLAHHVAEPAARRGMRAAEGPAAAGRSAAAAGPRLLNHRADALGHGDADGDLGERSHETHALPPLPETTVPSVGARVRSVRGKIPRRHASATFSQTPPSGLSVRMRTGRGSRPGTEVKRNRARSVASTITASCSAKEAPMQMRGPPPKGR